MLTRWPPWDHPRSRGVYQRVGDLGAERDGSSPLARGLLGVPYVWGGSSRIIPARAGFTRRPLRLGRIVKDHPRSRGVYERRSSVSLCWRGSSPLARGLRQPRPHSRAYRRIIPARAGFTYKDTSGLEVGTDHPRSRGVYSGDTSGVGSTAGSSPLARGLPRMSGGLTTSNRIIPARAGFTWRNCGAQRTGGDHPRSRGVYYG